MSETRYRYLSFRNNTQELFYRNRDGWWEAEGKPLTGERALELLEVYFQSLTPPLSILPWEVKP